MKFYIDTANVDEIRKANDMGVIAGVTTNPSLIAKEGRDYAETLKEITTIVDGPISGEVKATTADAEGMIAEGRAIYALDPKHMVVKIPMTAEGLTLNRETDSDHVRYGSASLKVSYDAAKGGMAGIVTTLAIAAGERNLSLWVYGDGSQNSLRQILEQIRRENQKHGDAQSSDQTGDLRFRSRRFGDRRARGAAGDGKSLK